MIQAQKENTEKLARALLERETLTRDEVSALLGVEHAVANVLPASCRKADGKVPA
jgi:ATP-dependent Zn protease